MDHENGSSTLAYRLVQTSDDDVGRHLVASHDLSPGDIVLTERPLVFGPKAMLDPEVAMPCVGCYKPVFTESGERCTKCGWPVCSGNCPGLKDPRHHGAECDILSLRPECVLKNMADYYRHDALMPLRCALLQKTDPEGWKQLLDLQSHMECRPPGSEAYEEANEFIVEYIINNFINKMDEKLRKSYEITSELLHRICGIIDTNALEIRLPQGTELSALYAVTCKMEHSCMPNTKHTSFAFNPKDRKDLYEITIKAVVPIMKNDHIATMYSHALWGTQARRQHLKDSKYFACKCPRCSDPTELGTYLSAMRCLGDENKPCDGIHLPEDPLDDETDWVCNKCPVRVSSSQVHMIMSQMGEDVEAVLMMEGSVTILENLLCRLAMFLHPNHYYMYSLKHSLVQLYGREQGYTSMDILDKKIKMCRELISITKALDPGNARLSLYNTVLQHELHSALVMKCKNMVGPKTEDMKPLLNEAKLAIDDAFKSVKDDLEEVSGKRLQSVLDDSKREFDKFCKQKKIVV
ncbi:SET domain-containing protein SmydA-8-like [Spodoptera frugiperda]|uniref:SET domain-containing protein SmydA-8-like n=1 Tax=Spodoptera frugiperda TaxID=7108 RepID=A0A9R0EU36_SPOFR|nr:SET domain-containing protein SmydA-8-like [Spodoptera frugiperda]XP_050549602.1 SET domain-containing protein SmydA-8-like [Spodoptera frugiperda]